MSYGPEHRNRAQQLGAVEAKTLVGTIAGLDRLLSARQMEQIQRVLDAAVLNPVLRKEADDAYKGSVIAQSGMVVNRDPAKVAQAQKLSERQIPVDKGDQRIKLDWHKLVRADDLSPRTNNPDEANYLIKVRNTLAAEGIWLRLGQPFDRSPDRKAAVNPKSWEIWLSLGPDGDTIPTKDYVIDREELLKTTLLGAGFYRAVNTGPVQSSIKRVHERLWSSLVAGRAEHDRLYRRYRDAFPGVAEISDWTGGTSLPSAKIWEDCYTILIKSSEYNTAGDVMTSQQFLVLAGLYIQDNTDKLNDYAAKSASGAQKWVGRFQTVAAVADVLETAMILTGVGLVEKGATSFVKRLAGLTVKDRAKAWLKDQVEDGVRDKMVEVYFARRK